MTTDLLYRSGGMGHRLPRIYHELVWLVGSMPAGRECAVDWWMTIDDAEMRMRGERYTEAGKTGEGWIGVTHRPSRPAMYLFAHEGSTIPQSSISTVVPSDLPPTRSANSS